MNVLERWNKSLEEGCVYRTHSEIVEFFCRHVIPFIQKQPDLQPLIIAWRKDYETHLLEIKCLQQKTLQESESVFREIVQTAGEATDIIRLKMVDIEDILSGKPGKEGFSSWPLYRKAYFAVKELLEMFLDDGKLDFCARYATLGTTTRYSDVNGTMQYGKKPCILEFTFSSTIMEASRKEQAFSAPQDQDPAIVWKYFETALQFWNANEADMKESLTFLFKSDPFQALSQKAAWQEIAQVKCRIQETKDPLLFTAKLFKNGLRTLINEVTLFFSHGCQSTQVTVEEEKSCL